MKPPTLVLTLRFGVTHREDARDIIDAISECARAIARIVGVKASLTVGADGSDPHDQDTFSNVMRAPDSKAN